MTPTSTSSPSATTPAARAWPGGCTPRSPRRRWPGARALKAITSPGNQESLAFHRGLGFTLTPVQDYGGAGQARVVMRKTL